MLIFLPLMETPTPTLTPADRTHLIFDGMFKYVAEKVAWNSIPIPLIKLTWRRLHRLRARFASLLARYRAGTLPAAATAPAPRSAPVRPATDPLAPPCPAAAPPPSDPRAPPVQRRHWGWILRISGHLVIPGYELEKFVEDPELAALVAAAPQFGSVLRPMCHMLAVRMPPWLRRPRRPRPPRRPKQYPPAPDDLLNAPDAVLRPDGSVWMHLGASTKWRPGFGTGRTLEEARKFDPPIRIWPRPL